MISAKPTYLALGDSYTIGEGVLPSDRWPVMLSERLQWEAPQIIATTGWTTAELLEGIKQSTLAPAYDWVSLLIGVNNQYRGQSVEEYKADLNRLAEVMLPLVNYQRHRIFLLSIPDYGVTPFARDKNPEQISRALQTFNQAKHTFATQQKFQYADITALSLLAKGNEAYLAADQLHPSGLMYEGWVNELIKSCTFS